MSILGQTAASSDLARGNVATPAGLCQPYAPGAWQTTLNGAVTLPQATITLTDASLASSGGGTVRIGPTFELVTYTGKSGNNLTGCTGGTGSISSGEVVTTAPDGWLLLWGTALDRTRWATLFAALGGTSSPWGLPSGSTFSLPDLRGRHPLGQADSGTGATIGSTGGSAAHSHDANTLAASPHGHLPGSLATPAHSHSAWISFPHVHNIAVYEDKFLGGTSFSYVPTGGNAMGDPTFAGFGPGSTASASRSVSGQTADATPGVVNSTDPADVPYLTTQFIIHA